LEINQQHVNEESSEEAESEENKSVSLGTFIDENSNILSLYSAYSPLCRLPFPASLIVRLRPLHRV
jgi:hypothetical protein